ncbi:MAG: DUF853 family protein, partial [Deltaproteobacteria bacterium]
MGENAGILLGKGETPQHLLLRFANRHGLIAGATGTGKTISLQVLAEGFSSHGIPVFLADVKGDLSGISRPGLPQAKLVERAQVVGIGDYRFQAFPTIYWDIFGVQGHPVRTTISDMGPILLSRLLELNDTQEGVLNVTFKLADDQGLLLLDLKDLRALLNLVAESSRTLSAEYGTVRKASVGAIQRRLLVLEQQGGANLFGEPALDLRDLMRTDARGYGYINVLAADMLMQYPQLYATFMLWILAEFFEELPEVGDQEKPLLAVFFDEAHLLFDDAPKALVDKVEQVARLIRSKGIGLYFISQSPLDIPDDVLGQLGNRVQHALRAFTPRDQKAVRAAAETFRVNPAFDASTAITELGVGEALVSTLEGTGVPGVVQRTLIRPPCSRIGPASPEERRAAMSQSPFVGRYDELRDRESAYEILKARTAKVPSPSAESPDDRTRPQERSGRTASGGSTRQGLWEAMAKSLLRSI